MSTAPASYSAADETGRDSQSVFYRKADALYRCAVECCRQHERLARLVDRGALPAEQRAAQSLVRLADEALLELASAYEKAAAKWHPESKDACWQAANGLWMAGREYARRATTSDRAARNIGETGDHSVARLTELALDYDLEASALLLLKQATEAYGKTRPDAH
ncbi:MAG: hypothetical protein ACXWZS_12450 [Gemmatirosa sp.]